MKKKTAHGNDDSYKRGRQRIQEDESHPLVQSFLKTAEHQRLYQSSIHQETKETEEELDLAFRKYYAELRLIRMLSNNLNRHAIRYDQKRNRRNQRQLLILDEPASYETDTVTTNLDQVKDPWEIPVDQTVIEKEDGLENKIENPVLYHAINSLTARQRHILEHAYLQGMTDTEIAEVSGVSQQSVSKLRNKALSKLKKYLLEWNDNE